VRTRTGPRQGRRTGQGEEGDNVAQLKKPKSTKPILPGKAFRQGGKAGGTLGEGLDLATIWGRGKEMMEGLLGPEGMPVVERPSEKYERR